MKMNIQESFVKKTLNKKTSDIVPTKLELDVQSFISLLSEYTDSLGITNFSKGDIVDTKSESGRELPFIVQKEVKRIVNLDVKSFVVSLVVSPYSYFWGKATKIPVFDLKFRVLFYPNNNGIRIGIYVNEYKRECYSKIGIPCDFAPRYFFRKSDGRFLDKSHDFFSRPQKFFELTKMGVDSDTLGICKNYIKRIADFKVEPEKGVGVLNLSNDSLEDSVIKVQSIFGDELFCLEEKVLESFTKKVSRKNSSELVSDIDYPDGVYILHDTLGVKTVDSWNPKNNKGVVGILVIEDDHKIVVATEDAPEDLPWSKKPKSVNQPIEELEDAESDFNGEIYCRRLDSPDFPAAYYCKTYNKGGRSWYLPSTGELWLICRHLEEIQNALETVGGQKLITRWDEGVPVYRSSTENSDTYAWRLYLTDRYLGWSYKGINSGKVRPVSKFDFSTLKESFTRKIRSKKNDELTTKADTAFVPDGVYILHDTLGVRTVDGWNPRNNYGVVGVLVVEDDHKIVIATEDAPVKLKWSKKRELINEPIKKKEDAESDFNGEEHCIKFNSTDFPAAYYCKTYNKGGRNWYLPSSGELRLIYNHLEEIQTALSIVGGQKLITTCDEGVPTYWSSTEGSAACAWTLDLSNGILGWYGKVSGNGKVRPVSAFHSSLKESFTRKIRSKKNDELTTKADTAFVSDGVYILHETLGVKSVEGWKPKNNDGVVGVLVVEDEHKIVVATEDAPENLTWSKKRGLINQPVGELEDAESDFSGEMYCRKLNSPNYPAAYYCKTYNKGGRSWYLPSSGELWLIYNHLEEIQNALETVGGQKLITTWDEGVPTYWSSTESSAMDAWSLLLTHGSLYYWDDKVGDIAKVRPVSNFNLSELKESFVKKTRKIGTEGIVSDADDKAFNPVMDTKEFVRRMKECILSYKQPYVYGKKNPYNLERFSFEMITSWPNTFKFNDLYSNELLFDVSNSKKPFFRIKLIFFYGNSKNIICYLTVGPNIYDERLFQYIYDSKKKRISFVENPKGVRFDDKVESIEPTLKNLNFILNDIRFLMDNWKILYKTYLKKNSFETWNEFYKMLPSQNNKGFDFDLKESFVHKISKKTSGSLKGREMFGEMESFGEFDMLFKRFLKKHENQFSSCFMTNYPFKSKMSGLFRIGYKVVLKKDCPFEDGSNDTTTLKFELDVFQEGIMYFPGKDDLNTPHGILTPAFFIELGPHTPQQIYLGNLEFVGESESLEDFRFDKFEERREWKKPNYSYRLLFGFEKFLLALVKTVNNMDEQTWSEIGRTSANFKPFKGEACCGADSKIILDILDKHGFYSELHKNFSKVNLAELNESFTKKIKNRSSKDLTDNQSFQLENGLYILHETLGVRTVDGWNPKNNDGVVGILLIEDDHKIVVATKDAPKKLIWSKKRGLINQPIEKLEDAESDFNGEIYCQKLDSPDFPAAYYCKTYNKGNRDWYLPSSGELRLIYNHLEEIQNALSIVGGQKLITTWDDDVPWYWSSTEFSASGAWHLYLDDGNLSHGGNKVSFSNKVRPVSKFDFSTLKESFTRKIRSKKNDELTTKADTAFEIPDGVYILHETLGVKSVNGWNPKDNKGVVGILLVEDDYKIVVALENSPKMLRWSTKYELINESIEEDEDVESDFNGENHCINLNSPDFPAAYYCLNYKKGGRNWHLPSSGELWLIYNHLEEIQTALKTVGGQKFATSWDEGYPIYWSSTELDNSDAWELDLSNDTLLWYDKVEVVFNVRPVSKFGPSTLKESFTRKISRKKNDELTTKADTVFFEIPDGVYILHQTLGVRTVDSWNPKDNEGVVGILLIEDDHKIVVALEDSPEDLLWSKERKLVNEPIEEEGDVASDFNGEKHCINLNSPDFPAAYYCKTYNKGGRSWYLPSAGELWLIYNHLEEIQSALEVVGGKKFVTSWFDGYPVYWSSTECSFPEDSATYACVLELPEGYLEDGCKKIEDRRKVRPVSKFGPSNTLKESFTRKIRSKKNDELISKTGVETFIPEGVYILHETLGVRTVDSWNPKNNDGVVGILLIEDEHKIVVALEDSPNNLTWSSEYGLINQPVDFDELENAEPDFNGEYYCQRLDSPNYPAAYYCKTYNKGNRSWYLPSAGELRLIYNHLEEVQNALETVGGQKFVTNWNEGDPAYWSSTEDSATNAWALDTYNVYLDNYYNKVSDCAKVRPVSNFSQNKNLKESFTKKTTTKGRNEIIGQADNLVVDYENVIKGLIKKYGFSTIHKYVLSLSRGVGYKEPPYVRRHEPFTEDKMVTILGELEFDKSETSDNDITVIWRKTKKFHYRTPIEKTEKFSELSEDEKRDIYKYLIKRLNVRIDEDEKIEKMDKLPQPSRNVV